MLLSVPTNHCVEITESWQFEKILLCFECYGEGKMGSGERRDSGKYPSKLTLFSWGWEGGKVGDISFGSVFFQLLIWVCLFFSLLAFFFLFFFQKHILMIFLCLLDTFRHQWICIPGPFHLWDADQNVRAGGPHVLPILLQHFWLLCKFKQFACFVKKKGE